MTLEALLHRLVRELVQEELRGLTIPSGSGSPANDLGQARGAPMTTAQAARYCGFKTTAAIRKAFGEGRLVPLGRAGRKGTYIWSRQALDAFLAGARGGIVRLGRPGAPPDEHRRTSWKERNGSRDGSTAIAPKPSRPGVWRLRGGGYLVRGRATDFRTGKQREILRTVKDTDAAGAYRLLQDELDEVRSGGGEAALERCASANTRRRCSKERCSRVRSDRRRHGRTGS